MLLEAYGKHLRHRYDTAAALHAHLQGKWLRLDASRPGRAQVRLRLADPDVAWDLIAPATYRLLDPVEEEPHHHRARHHRPGMSP